MSDRPRDDLCNNYVLMNGYMMEMMTVEVGHLLVRQALTVQPRSWRRRWSSFLLLCCLQSGVLLL
jgi:hypothetical protein